MSSKAKRQLPADPKCNPCHKDDPDTPFEMCRSCAAWIEARTPSGAEAGVETPKVISAAKHELNRAAEMYERHGLPGRAERARSVGRELPGDDAPPTEAPATERDIPCESGENDAYGAATNTVWRIVNTENNPESVVFQLWDLIRAAIGGQDKERLSAAKNQAKELADQFASELVVLVHRRIETNLVSQKTGASVAEIAAEKGFARDYETANQDNIARLVDFGRFLFDREQHLGFWISRIDVIFWGKARDTFSAGIDGIVRDMGWK